MKVEKRISPAGKRQREKTKSVKEKRKVEIGRTEGLKKTKRNFFLIYRKEKRRNVKVKRETDRESKKKWVSYSFWSASFFSHTAFRDWSDWSSFRWRPRKLRRERSKRERET